MMNDEKLRKAQSSTRFAIYGTKIDFQTYSTNPEVLSEKSQYAVDEKGRRRFHGAFTGGFSAGYFNSVDTKEGWMPQNFFSTKMNRTNRNLNTKPESFMDEEDFSEFGIAPKRFTSDKKFDFCSTECDSKKSLPEALNEAIFVEKDLKIGDRLLKAVGYGSEETKTNSNPTKVYSCQLPEGLLKKTATQSKKKHVDSNITIKYKDDTYGLGFKPYSGTKSTNRNKSSKLLSHRGFSGEAFGTGVLNSDDEDSEIYQDSDNYNEYDFYQSIDSLEDHDKELNLQVHKIYFIEDDEPLRIKTFDPIIIPPDFDENKSSFNLENHNGEVNNPTCTQNTDMPSKHKNTQKLASNYLKNKFQKALNSSKNDSKPIDTKFKKFVPGDLIRESSNWQPSSLLCKRFNVQHHQIPGDFDERTGNLIKTPKQEKIFTDDLEQEEKPSDVQFSWPRMATTDFLKSIFKFN